jgi:catechol 2,3-dioxygenase-like lactoylglutathione lyase family enzyme
MPSSTTRVGALRERSAELVVELPVSDLAASVGFYEQAGFLVERRADTFAALRWGETYLFLTVRLEVSLGVHPVNIRVVVDDLDDRYAAARQAGLTIRYEPMDRPYGLRDFTVVDPDGYELRFATPI